MNYDELSDFEINKWVAEVLGIDHHCDDCKFPNPPPKDPDGYRMVTRKITDNPRHWRELNPVGDWRDAGPIIEQHNIGLFPSIKKGFWIAETNKYIGVRHESPRRAAMVFLLKMKDEEEEQ